DDAAARQSLGRQRQARLVHAVVRNENRRAVVREPVRNSVFAQHGDDLAGIVRTQAGKKRGVRRVGRPPDDGGQSDNNKTENDPGCNPPPDAHARPNLRDLGTKAIPQLAHDAITPSATPASASARGTRPPACCEWQWSAPGPATPAPPRSCLGAGCPFLPRPAAAPP